MSVFGVRLGRGVLALLVTLMIAGQSAGSCPVLPVGLEVTAASSPTQDCADHVPVENGGAAVEFRRGAVDEDTHRPAAAGPAASRTGATGRRPHRRRRRRAPPAGRALLQRLCVART